MIKSQLKHIKITSTPDRSNSIFTKKKSVTKIISIEKNKTISSALSQ